MDIFVAAVWDLTEQVAGFLDANPELVDTQDEYGCVPLTLAAEQWQLPAMQLLIDRGSDVNASDKRKNAVLNYAAHYWQWEGEQDEHIVTDEQLQRNVAELLVTRGADVNTKDWHGVTPLHRACRFEYIGIVSILLEHGADVDARDKAGETPLRRAVKNPRAFELVKLLLAHGADLQATDTKGVTILKAAQGKAMKDFLRQCGATP